MGGTTGGRYWPTAKAYRALGLDVPVEVLEADAAAGITDDDVGLYVAVESIR